MTRPLPPLTRPMTHPLRPLTRPLTVLPTRPAGGAHVSCLRAAVGIPERDTAMGGGGGRQHSLPRHRLRRGGRRCARGRARHGGARRRRWQRAEAAVSDRHDQRDTSRRQVHLGRHLGGISADLGGSRWISADLGGSRQSSAELGGARRSSAEIDDAAPRRSRPPPPPVPSRRVDVPFQDGRLQHRHRGHFPLEAGETRLVFQLALERTRVPPCLTSCTHRVGTFLYAVADDILPQKKKSA